MGNPPVIPKDGVSHIESIGVGGETGELKHLRYPEERTSTETPLVVASEMGPASVLFLTGTVWNVRP